MSHPWKKPFKDYKNLTCNKCQTDGLCWKIDEITNKPRLAYTKSGIFHTCTTTPLQNREFRNQQAEKKESYKPGFDKVKRY